MIFVLMPAGHYQIEICKTLKSQGHFVVGVNPFETQTSKMCDQFICEDIKNIENISKLLKIKPNMIITDQCDSAVIPCTKLAHIFSIPSFPNISPSNAMLFTNKQAMYNHAMKQKIPIPQFEVVENAMEIKINGNIILKPIDSTSSRGFQKSKKEDITEEFFNTSKKQGSGKVIAQREVFGEEISIEGFCINGKHKSIVASDKNSNLNIVSNLYENRFWPSQKKQEILKRVFEMNDRFVESSGLIHGITHAEYMIDADDIWMIEIACRGGGHHISSKVIKELTDVNIYENILKIKNYPKLLRNKNVLLKFFYLKKTITENEEKEIKKIKNIVELDTRNCKCVTPNEILLNSDSRMYVIISSTDINEITNSVKEIEKIIEQFK